MASAKSKRTRHVVLFDDSISSLLFYVKTFLFHSPHVILTAKVAPLIDSHEVLQRISSDDSLSSDLQHRQLTPLHQLPHRVPPDSGNLGGLVNGNAQFDNADSICLPSNVAICNKYSAIIQRVNSFVKIIMQHFLRIIEIWYCIMQQYVLN